MNKNDKVFRGNRKVLSGLLDVKMLGAIFKERGKITERNIEEIKDYRQKVSCSFGEAAVALKLVTYDDLAQALSEQSGYDYMEIKDIPMSSIDTDLCQRVGWDVINDQKFLPLVEKFILLQDPSNMAALNILDQVLTPALRATYEVKLVSQTTMQELINRQLSSLTAAQSNISQSQLISAREQMEMIISDAMINGASDIHMVPKVDEMHIQFRINGLLETQKKYELLKEQASALIVVMKQIFNMDVVKHYVPQDGGGTVVMSRGGKADVRASILPTIWGEGAVLRILQQKTCFTTDPKNPLGSIGHSDINVKLMREILSARDGMFVITGPTGSGKTTTIYNALQFLHDTRPDLSIITIEDPVEYKNAYAKQVQVQSDVKTKESQKDNVTTFSSALRAVLRHDPDIIFVGEIRDAETAELAVRAALTGHYVLTTMHTRNAPSAIIRLEDLGIKRLLVAETALGFMAQRLVGTVCKSCCIKKEISDKGKDNLQSRLNPLFGDDPIGRAILDKMMGSKLAVRNNSKDNTCLECKGTGYGGRLPISEVLVINDSIREAILSESTMGIVIQRAYETGFRPLIYDVARKVADGLVDPHELRYYLGL